MTDLSVAAASEADVDAICALLSDLFTQEADFRVDHDKQARAVREMIASPDKAQILLLKVDETIAGMVSLLYLISTAMGGKVAMLEDMIIAASHRSRGYGQHLLNAAIDFAKEQGCLRVTLLTDADNERGQQFYQRQGFVHSAMVPMRLILQDD